MSYDSVYDLARRRTICRGSVRITLPSDSVLQTALCADDIKHHDANDDFTGKKTTADLLCRRPDCELIMSACLSTGEKKLIGCQFSARHGFWTCFRKIKTNSKTVN